MPEPTNPPTTVGDPRVTLTLSLAKALAAVYAPQVAPAIAIGNALAQTLIAYRQANNLPADWLPSATDWDNLIRFNQEWTAERYKTGE